MDNMTGETWRIIECTKSSEYVALSDLNKEIYQILISAVQLNLTEGSKAHTLLWGMFPAGTVTGDALRNPINGLSPLPATPNP